jgi:hypothetical protein
MRQSRLGDSVLRKIEFSIYAGLYHLLLWGSLITPFCFPTWAFFQLRRYQNTHPDSYRDSVFGALYQKKIPALVFQKELIEVPFCFI